MLDRNAATSFCSCHNFASPLVLTRDCHCGEMNTAEFEWNWEERKESTIKMPGPGCVYFNPVYSQGTATVRGDRSFARGGHHFFEIKMTSVICGTDVMVGVGTSAVDLHKHKYEYTSALGACAESWGFSYRGAVQHKGIFKYYGKKFSSSSIVGVHLDMYRGTLEFYVNRVPLGIAYDNLPLDKPLFPMISATATRISMRLINSTSFPECLQYQAMKAVSRHPGLLAKMKLCPGLKEYSEKLWYLQSTDKFQYNREEKQGIADIDEDAQSIGCGCTAKLQSFGGSSYAKFKRITSK